MRYAVMLIASCGIMAACEEGSLTDANIPLCTTGTAYAIGTTVSGTVDQNDCKDSQGNVGDVYQFTAGSQTSFVVNFSGSGFNPSIVLYQGTIANASSARAVADVGRSDASSFQAFLPAGAYYFVVTSENSSGGSYNFSTTAGANMDGCKNALSYVAIGITLSGTITGNDCTGLGASRFDAYEFYLQSGQTVNVSGTLNKGGAFALRTGSATSADLVSRFINTTIGGTASFSYTAASAGLYRVHVASEPAMAGNATYVVGIN